MRISDWSSDVCSSDLGIVDVLIAGHRVLAEQRDGRHDLARLAVAALHHVELFPGGLHRPSRLAVDRLDGGDRAAGDVADRGDARARGDAVHMHGASTAHRHATAEFGAGQPELVADDPEQRRVLGNVEITFLAIDLKLHHVSHSLFSGGFQWWTSPCVQEAEATRDSAPSRKPAGPKVGKLTSLQLGRLWQPDQARARKSGGE